MPSVFRTRERSKKEVPPLSMVTRSRALMDAVEEDDSSSESSNNEAEALMLLNAEMVKDPDSFYVIIKTLLSVLGVETQSKKNF